MVNKGRVTNIFLYSIGNYLYVGINAISNIFISNILGPTGNGIISYFNAISVNINNVIYGTVRSSVERTVPALKGFDEKKTYAQEAFSLNFVFTLLVSLFFVVLGGVSNNSLIRESAFFVAILNPITSIADFYRIWTKSLNRINIVSWIMIVSAILIPIFAILFSYFFHLKGFWIGRILLQSVVLLLYIIISIYTFKITIPRNDTVKRILISGGEILLFTLIVTAINTVDKFFVKYSLGVTELGYYSLGTMLFSMLILLPSSIIGAIYPSFVAKVNENLKEQVIKYTSIMEFGSFVIAISLYYIVPFVVELFLPLYQDSIPIIRILLIAFITYSSVQFKYIDMVRKRRMKSLILFSLPALLCAIIAFFVISIVGSDIIVYSFVTSICYVILSIGVNISWCLTYSMNIVSMLKYIIKSLLYVMVFLLIIY